MSYSFGNRVEYLLEKSDVSQEDFRRDVASVVNGVLKGKTNNTFTISPEEGSVRTEFDWPAAKEGGVVFLFPKTSSAAQLSSSSSVYAFLENGKLVVVHGSATGTEQYSAIVAS